MEINDYKGGDNVEILMNNIQTNENEWRTAEVLDKRICYPNHGERFKPYPILIVRVIRTYCKATPIYKWLNGNIPVFVDNDLEFYDKENDEGIIYKDRIRLKK